MFHFDRNRATIFVDIKPMPKYLKLKSLFCCCHSKNRLLINSNGNFYSAMYSSGFDRHTSKNNQRINYYKFVVTIYILQWHYTRFQNYATLRENRLRSNVSFMSYLLLKIANVNKRDFILYLSKETNIEANEGRFTNENKLQTFSSEIYIMNHFQTRKKNNLVDLNYI